MKHWTAEAIAAELARRLLIRSEGRCPDSGLPLLDGRCGVCDCLAPVHTPETTKPVVPME